MHNQSTCAILDYGLILAVKPKLAVETTILVLVSSVAESCNPIFIALTLDGVPLGLGLC